MDVEIISLWLQKQEVEHTAKFTGEKTADLWTLRISHRGGMASSGNDTLGLNPNTQFHDLVWYFILSEVTFFSQ